MIARRPRPSSGSIPHDAVFAAGPECRRCSPEPVTGHDAACRKIPITLSAAVLRRGTDAPASRSDQTRAWKNRAEACSRQSYARHRQRQGLLNLHKPAAPPRPSHRDFLHERFSDACRPPAQRVPSRRRPTNLHQGRHSKARRKSSFRSALLRWRRIGTGCGGAPRYPCDAAPLSDTPLAGGGRSHARRRIPSD